MQTVGGDHIIKFFFRERQRLSYPTTSTRGEKFCIMSYGVCVQFFDPAPLPDRISFDLFFFHFFLLFAPAGFEPAIGARDFGAGHPATYPTFALRLPLPPRCKKTKIPAGGYEIMPPGGVTLWEGYVFPPRS